MATLRSSLPSRLRQLFSNEGSFGPSVQIDSETPPKIKAFIDKVFQSPLQDLAIPLSGFRWEYNKGNFHHWRPLFHHFDTYFKAFLIQRNDLLLSDTITEDEVPFPKHAVLQILRVMQIILENCHNKGSFDGVENFKFLLASTDPEVLLATLETLSALVKIPPSKLHVSGKMIGLGSINSCLLSLAQGWGSKEEGLGLYSCVVANEKSQEEGLSLFPSDVQDKEEKSQTRLGSTLYFELHGISPQRSGESSSDVKSSSSTMIHMPDLHLKKEDDLLLLKQCIEQYNVPIEQRFSLLTRIRYAHAFRSPRSGRLYSRICLLAFIVLVQSNDANEELVCFFANEPEYTNELIKIVRSEETISGTVRTLAMLALGAQLAAYSSSHDRARMLSGSSINFAGGNRMILLNVLQKAILSLKNSNDPSSLAFVEALLQFYLLHVISTSSSGSIIRGSGMVPTFLPLLEDSDPAHMHLVCYAVKTLQKLMDYSNVAVTLLKDSGGVELLAQRLHIEVQRVIGTAGSDDVMILGEGSSPTEDNLHGQKRLIRALLKALGSATYAPTYTSSSQSSHDSTLPATLALIFGNVGKFGGDIYCSAVTVMSEILHKDPTCFPILHEMGLPDAFLSSVVAGVLPSAKALTCVPSGLGAICLNSKGLEAVKETSALRFLLDIFTCKKYVVAMNEAIVPLANGVEELLRHVSSLRSTGVDIIIEIVNRISSIGEGSSSGSSEKVNEGNSMEMDSEERASGSESSSTVTLSDSAGEGITDEQFINLSVFHAMVLIHRTMENSETCRLFVEKSGIDALLKLLLRPSIAQSSEGMAIALHSTMVFKGFTQHHSAPLARAFCSFLRDHLKKALTGFNLAAGNFLLDSKTKIDHGVFSSLFLVEFLLFLAAAKENRWISALLTEFGGDNKDVLEDIGRVHREILWQIALLEDAKVEVPEGAGSVSASESQQVSSSGGTEEQRVTSFRQLLDPLFRRRMSGWSVESQFFDLINLYRDLGRASGIQRSTSDGSNLRIGSSQQSSESGGSDTTDTVLRREEDKQKNYYSSCCDMVKSLALHIMHLLQELGKSMLLPSRRRDDAINISPSSKAVVSAFASLCLGHMNFEGHMSPSGSEASISSKCRYFGKVVDFIDGILMDRHDSCNPVLLNCLYGQGVIQSMLTTFEATSQLLFTVPASPMETDDGNLKYEKKEESELSWLYGPLASYGKLMDHLVTSSYILSPFTKHLLVQPVSNSNVPFPQDAETFVKVLQSMVLKAVLPVWTHPEFVDCSYEFITTIISVIRHIYSGVEVKNVSSSSSSRLTTGPPPNEAAITTIVEMGFSRARAEEALRQVGANSVELAMEWLFSHQEEVQEDDELARALAMSLGNSGSDSKEEVANENSRQFEVEMAQLPPIDELLLTCIKLLQSKESLAFPVRDLLMTMCSQNDGQYRSNVISFIIDQVKRCNSVTDRGNSSMLSALFHVLALILHEDAVSRETCLKNGLVELVSEVLWKWDGESSGGADILVPKWVTAAFLAVDRLLQVDQKLNPEIIELLKRNTESSQQTSIVIDENKQSKPLESLQQRVNFDQQKRLVEVACNCMRKLLHSETMHSILLLCATLTRTHSVAVHFLDAGGLPLLLNLPTSSLFAGFDNIASTIIRHILEDPQTLQQAMESEIRHNIVTATNRQSSGRLTVRNFLVNLTSVISRDPVVFMQAVQSVCQVEMVGDRPYIVLLKDREKDKLKDREKEKEKTSEKEKPLGTDAKPAPGGLSSMALGGGHGKLQESKSFKAHRKPPQSFVSVIELLLDTVVMFKPPSKDDSLPGASGTLSAANMDVDVAASKGKGKALASESEENEAQNQDVSASLAKIVFILKLLTETLVTYSASVHVLLRKDVELSSCRSLPQRGPSGCNSGGGLFHHILHKFVPYSKRPKKEKKVEGDWKHKLASRAGQFLVAACVRSAEARKRIFTEINSVFSDFVESAEGFISPGNEILAFIELLNDVLVARSPTGSYISSEASATFVDVGLVRSLTRTLQVLDLDLGDSLSVVTGLIKALELVTKEHIHSADAIGGKNDNSAKPSDIDLHESIDNSGDGVQAMEAASQENDNSVTDARGDSFSVGHMYGGSEAVTDDMEHDQDLDGGFAANEDDFMHDTPEDGRGLENGVSSVGIRFEIQTDGQENLDDDDDDDDDEMSGDDADDGDDDEDDEDEDEHNDLEEDEDHHLPHPDTDQDDHEMDEDEFDEEVLEEEDEEDEDDEDGLILRLEEGINGINVLDHIEVFGRDHSFANETLQVMPVELFGSRRQGRSTSIYNLLGRSDGTMPSQHPLLVETHPSSTLATSRASENTSDSLLSDRNLDTTSRLDTIFRSARNGRQSHRFNLWLDDNEQGGGSSSSAAIPQGLEEFLVSQLRRPDMEKPSDQNKTSVDSERKVDGSELQLSETSMREGTPVESNANDQNSYPPATSSENLGSSNPENRLGSTPPLQGTDLSCTQSQSVDMQFEHNDVAIRDIEAVSQESGGSGATLGESLRSLDVEIGSADGHDDGADRQGSADRMPQGESLGTRTRRNTVSFGTTAPAGGRETSLHSLSEVAENPSQEAEEVVPVDRQQMTGDGDSGSIDPAFLDALPEELRAEVLSAQQSQATQPPNAEQQNSGDIDPEFLAALPADIRAEVLAQQQAQRVHQSQELEGQPVEMDTVSIIATFPSELREEVLLTSSDAVLANLTPALVAEANMLRERFAHRYHSRTLFGMYPRSRRGESSRRGEGSSLDRAVGTVASRRSIGRLLEADGAPLVDTSALKGMIRLLRVVQQVYKGSFQRLLLNLCAHTETRTALVNILMEMLMLDEHKQGNLQNDAEPSYRLYACQSHVMYSRPQFIDGVPPLVSRRVLETLTYLARNHPYVAKILLELRLPQKSHCLSENADKVHGKAVMIVENENTEMHEELHPVALLLSLLHQPLYLRSNAHLEQLLSLLDVIIDKARSKSSSSSKPGLPTPEQQSGSSEVPSTDADAEMHTTDSGIIPSEANTGSKVDSMAPSVSGASEAYDAQTVLLSLPQADLRLLCSLLATEGLSDNAYALVADVLKKLVAFTPSHCHLFITELANSVQKLSQSAMEELHSFGEAAGALLHSSSSDGAAILRVLQALSSLVSSVNQNPEDQRDVAGNDRNVALSLVRKINSVLEPLWLELSSCISRIEVYSDSGLELPSSSLVVKSKPSPASPPLPAGSQNVLPYIESFFVTCEKIYPGQPGTSQDFTVAAVPEVDDASTSASKQRTSGPVSSVDEKRVAFVKFTEKHRKLLNAFIRQNPGLLEKSFSLMIKVPRFIDFDNKRAHFRSKIKHQHDHHHSPLRISVRRAYILEDSYNQLRMRSTQELKGRLTVHFQGEEGIDAGGLTREWYQSLSRVIFDKGALLFTTVGNDSTFQPNPNSVYQTEHLSYFKFVGRVVGKALFDGQLLDVHFTRSFYKHILGVKVTYHDIEAIDPDYYKNLKWMLEHDISDVLDLTFSIDADEEKLILYERTQVTDYELIPGGRNIKVTEENKHQYVDLVAEHRLTTAIRPQINAFLEGFNELIARELISIFNDKELELLISGLPDIDLEDMRANTEYSGYSPASPVIQWFWEVVQGFSKEDKARLLQFVTGTSKVPLEGFSALQGISGAQKFQIHKAYGSPDHLPSAHTCFNQLDLPEYPSKEHLQERLLLAIHEASEGFGFG